MTRFLIVRHGESEWNALGKWQGRADPPLSELGRRQAFSAVEKLGVVDAIVASPLERASTTAAIIAEGLGVGPLVLEPRLVERDAGQWSGLTRSDIEREWPGYLESGQRPPGYESDEDLLDRVTDALDDLTSRLQVQEALVVAHGGVIYALEKLLGAEFERIPNLGARWIEWGATRSLGERLLLVDDDELTAQASDIL